MKKTMKKENMNHITRNYKDFSVIFVALTFASNLCIYYCPISAY